MRGFICLGRKLLLVILLTATSAAPALAGSFELSLLAGFRMGGELEDSTTSEYLPVEASPSFGLAIGFPLEPERILEVVGTHQEGQVDGASADGGPVGFDLDTVGIGGTADWRRGRWRPFLSGTAGLTILSPEQPGFDTVALFTMTLGGGVKVPVSPKLGLRFEGRGVFMLATSSTSGVCGSGRCVLSFSGSGIVQLELLTGLTWSL